jgi:DNA ligase 1
MDVALARELAPNARTVKTVCDALKIPLPPTGWLMSEKMDGIRAIWHQGKMITRGGNESVLPEDWRKRLPSDVGLDGELAVGSRQGSGLFRRKVPDDGEWRAVGARYFVFDVYDPEQMRGVFETRRDLYTSSILGLAQQVVQDVPKWVVPVNHIVCRNPLDEESFFQVILSQGGEGLVLRAPGSLYETGRTATLLKRKEVDTDTFTVQEVIEGKGKLAGKIGSIQVQRDRDGSVCNAGSVTDLSVGVGDKVMVKFMGVSDSGVPRNASFVEKVN